MTPPRGEQGFALVTAVVGMALFALLTLALLDTARGTAATAHATIARARLAAAADAGLAVAVANLRSTDRTRRWSIDGRQRRMSFAGSELDISVEDERGKVPLNQLTDEQARGVFETTGATGDALDRMVDGFLDWRDDDDDAREDGAEAPYYAALGYRPRNGALLSLDELIAVRGIDAGTLARLRPFVSVYRNQRDGFDERYAQPAALVVMNGGIAGPAAIQRARELAGQRVAIELSDGESLVGRPLTVRVVARDGAGGIVRRVTEIELTGTRERPYVVRQQS